MPRLSEEQWNQLRAEWEGEPTASFNALAEKYSINVSSVSRKAARDEWEKTNQLASINEAASLKADALVDSNGNALNAIANAKLALAQRDVSEDLRAQVQVRHRGEWSQLDEFRKTALKAMKDAHESGDRALWSIAKTAADTALSNIRALATKQDAERKAWGLDLRSEEEIVITNPRQAA